MKKYLVFTLLAASVLAGNYFKVNLFSPEVKISVLDLTVGILSAFAFILHPRKFVNLPKSLYIFLSICLLSLIPAFFRYGLNAVVVGLMYLLRFGIYSTFFITLGNLVERKDQTKLIMFVSVLFVASAAFQYLIFPDIRLLAVIGWDEHYYRAVGSLLDPGFLGLILVFFLVYLTSFKQKKYLFLWAATYVVFALTYSRSSFLAYFAAMTAVAIKKKSWKFFFGTLLLLTITIPLLPRASDGEGVKLERTNSIQARIDNWKNSLQIFADNPILGVGFNTYRYAQRDYGFISKSDWETTHAGAGADASLLFVFATTGIIGGVAFVFYSKDLWKINSLRPYLIPLFVHSLFLNSMFYPFVLLWISLILAKDYDQLSILSESDSRPSQTLEKSKRYPRR